jgi:hypothetical protein
MDKQSSHIKEVKELANRFTPKQLEECIAQHLEEGSNSCEVEGPQDEVLGILSKAGFVKDLMEEGNTLIDSLRELAKRIRAVQQGFQQKN